MKVRVSELGMNVTDVPIGPEHVCYRPPRWPPPTDWVVSEDAQGNPKSRWGDPVWDFSAWAFRTVKFDFAGGRHSRSAPSLSPENQHVMRLLATWILWGPMGARSWSNLRKHFDLLRRIVVLCNSQGVTASNLSHHSGLVGLLVGLYPSIDEGKKTLITLDRLLRSSVEIGFTLLDDAGIRCFSEALGARKTPDSGEDEIEQTAYIPPRIWVYQVSRLRECLDDFLTHREKIEDCFNFCVDAYAHNFGSLVSALTDKRERDRLRPFSKQPDGSGTLTGRQFHGRFEFTAQRYGIAELLERWVLPKKRGTIEITSFTAYLTLVQTVGVSYIASFTLQRKEEVAAFRADCLIWEQDPVLGRIPILCGEAIKTDPDSDARWPTSPSVEVAVSAMTAVSKLRMQCAAANPEVNCSDYDQSNPLLFHNAFEPWAPMPGGWKAYTTRPKVQSYTYFMQRYPRLFDPEVLKITEEDLVTARMFTPNLNKGGKFEIGKIWPLAYHMLRRTGGINMFASGLLSESSIQVIMKHVTLLQTRYYGRNFSRVRFNEDFESQIVSARYEVMGKQIQALVGERYVSPLGEERKREIVVNLIGANDFKKLVKAAQEGEVSFRETRLGGCAKNGHCDYGGIESVARCSGGDGDKPCREAIYDKSKRPAVERQLESIEVQMEGASPDSPRARALQAEIRGMRNYLDVVKN